MNNSKAYPRMFAAHSSLQESRQRTNLNEHLLQSIEPCRGHCHLRRKVATPSPVRVGLCVGLTNPNNTLYLIEVCDSYTYNVPTSFLYGVVTTVADNVLSKPLPQLKYSAFKYFFQT